MDFQPLRGTVVCEKIVPEKKSVVENGIAFETEQLPLYKILKIGKEVKNTDLKVGDVLVTDSIPTPLVKDKIYLLSEKYIAAAVS